MTYRMYAALIAGLSAVALVLAPNETFAKSGPGHSIFRPSIAHFFRHNRRNNFGNNFGAFWPGYGDFSYGSPSEPFIGGAQPIAGEIGNTCTYDIPWDWAHR